MSVLHFAHFDIAVCPSLYHAILTDSVSSFNRDPEEFAGENNGHQNWPPTGKLLWIAVKLRNLVFQTQPSDKVSLDKPDVLIVPTVHPTEKKKATGIRPVAPSRSVKTNPLGSRHYFRVRQR